MTSIIYTGLMTLLWIVNLFNGTGLDTVYHVTDYARNTVILLTVMSLVFRLRNREELTVDRMEFVIFGGMFTVFILSAFMREYGFISVHYLWVFCLIYLIGQMKIDEKVFLWTGIIYGVGGGAILFIYDYGTVLKGWNENSIAMIGMHSFLMLVIPFFNQSSKRSKIFLLLVTAVFSFLIFPTDSRSGILFMAIGVLLALNVIPRSLMLKNKVRVLVFLLVPLLIAVFVSVISHTNTMMSLNRWSIRQFEKPIFNGRDEIWRYGFKVLNENPIFGAGDMEIRAWHNNAITCLTAFGCVGFVLWIFSFEKIIKKGMAWSQDYLTVGCMASFLVLYLQQSVELGFIATKPSIIAYVMLGMMLGRVRYLKENSIQKGEIYHVQG